MINVITNQRWIRNLGQITTQLELEELIALWEELMTITLSQETPDTIKWRWTKDGEYITKSAYIIHFAGAVKRPGMMPIWKVKTEPKCKLFAWVLMQRKILTTDN